MARMSNHERALRAELEAAEGAYAALAVEVKEKQQTLADLESRLALLRRILDAGKNDPEPASYTPPEEQP